MKLWDYYSYWMTDAEKKRLHPLWLKDASTQRIVSGYWKRLTKLHKTLSNRYS